MRVLAKERPQATRQMGDEGEKTQNPPNFLSLSIPFICWHVRTVPGSLAKMPSRNANALGCSLICLWSCTKGSKSGGKINAPKTL